jgi:hypothetical protein
MGMDYHLNPPDEYVKEQVADAARAVVESIKGRTPIGNNEVLLKIPLEKWEELERLVLEWRSIR